MAQATFSVRMDENLKKQFDLLCSDFGMNASTAINIFAKVVVRERKIPFEIKATEPELSRHNVMQTFKAIREKAQIDFPDGMEMKEIEEEIHKARYNMEDNE